MARRAVIILLFLIAGAVVNVGVAWGASVWAGESRGGSRDFQSREGWTWDVQKNESLLLTVFELHRSRTLGDDPIATIPRDRLLPNWIGLAAETDGFRQFLATAMPGVDRRVSEFRMIVAAGWPMRTAW